MGEAQALVLAEPSTQIKDAIRRAGLETTFCDDAASFAKATHRSSGRMCLVDLDHRAGRDSIQQLLGDVESRHLPVLATWGHSHADDVDFRRAFDLGVDGIVLRTQPSALTRQAILLAKASQPRAGWRGAARVVHPRAELRQRMGRALYRFGFDVDYRGQLSDGGAAGPELLLVSDALLGSEPVSRAQELRKNVGAPVLIVCENSTTPRVVAAGVSIGSETCRLAELLFAMAESERPRGEDVRTSKRVLHRAACFLREAGTRLERCAMTLNVSSDGLFLETLDAPEAGEDVWLELRLESSSPVLHLRGRVAWRRLPHASTGGIGPAGAGIRLLAETCPPRDIEHFHSFYQRLVTEELEATQWRGPGRSPSPE